MGFCSMFKGFLLVVLYTVVMALLMSFYNNNGYGHPLLQPSRINQLNNIDGSKDSVGLLKLEDVPDMKVDGIDCHELFADSSDAIQQAAERQELTDANLTNDQVTELSMDCNSYRSSRGYILQPVSPEEADFPLAFSLVVFKDAHLVERLLRAIYRPQNHYCIHVDQKASIDFRNAIASVTRCFQNVFVSGTSVDVKWGEFSILEADMICLRKLWMFRNWKYFINLTGQEFPLKTNGEIVKILKVFNGANDALGSIHPEWLEGRLKKAQYAPPPYGIRLGKGQNHVILTRAFVNFTLHDKLALDFYDWLNDTDTYIQDESFFNSLNISPLLQIPGVYTGTLDPTDRNEKASVARYKHWEDYDPCPGREAHSICILTVYHLPKLAQSAALFANKFHSGYQPLAYRCMEELIADKVRAEVLGENDIDLTYYRNLPFVLHHRNR